MRRDRPVRPRRGMVVKMDANFRGLVWAVSHRLMEYSKSFTQVVNIGGKADQEANK